MGKLADYIGKYWAGAEVMYAVIIAMTFTSVLWNAEFAPDFIKENIVQTALACCIAWGVADGCFYIWERKYLMRQEKQIVELAREEGKKEDAMLQVKAQLDDSILRNIEPTKRERLYEALVSELAGADEVKGLDRGWALRIIFRHHIPLCLGRCGHPISHLLPRTVEHGDIGLQRHGHPIALRRRVQSW